MLRPKSIQLFIILLALLLTACGGGSADNTSSTSDIAGDVAQGESVFNENGCQACHTVEAGAPARIGPSLAGLAGVSAEIIEDPGYTGQAQTVEGFIRESILQPNIYVTPGYEPLMPQTYDNLSDQDLTDLIAYLLSL